MEILGRASVHSVLDRNCSIQVADGLGYVQTGNNSRPRACTEIMQ